MRDYNNVTLIGRLTKDPEINTIPSGSQVCNFSIAVNDDYKTSDGERKESASFFNCVAWQKLAELIEKYLTKGSKILLSGRLVQQSWEDDAGNKRTTVKITAENVQFLDSKSKTDDPTHYPTEVQEQTAPESPSKTPKKEVVENNEIPF